MLLLQAMARLGCGSRGSFWIAAEAFLSCASVLQAASPNHDASTPSDASSRSRSSVDAYRRDSMGAHLIHRRRLTLLAAELKTSSILRLSD